MEPISGADRLLALLRQKLEERARAGNAGKTRRKPSGGRQAEPAGIQAFAAIEGNDEQQLRRAFMQHLLADHFGPALINDASFQQLVSRVTDSINDHEPASKLLARLIAELRPA
jgi:hypothetical protein